MMYKIIVETAVYVEADSREQAKNIAVNAVGYGLNEQAVSDYDYIESAEVINRYPLDPDSTAWMINFIIQLPEGRTEIEPFSVLVLDTQ